MGLLRKGTTCIIAKFQRTDLAIYSDSREGKLPSYSQINMVFFCYLTLPYFFGYKTEFFSFQNNPKNLDPSYKTDLDLWDCLGRVQLVL